MFLHHAMKNYVIVKKSTLLMAGLAAAGLVGYHFYKHHRGEVKKDIEQFTEDVGDVAKKTAGKAKEVVKEATA